MSGTMYVHIEKADQCNRPDAARACLNPGVLLLLRHGAPGMLRPKKSWAGVAVSRG